MFTFRSAAIGGFVGLTMIACASVLIVSRHSFVKIDFIAGEHNGSMGDLISHSDTSDVLGYDTIGLEGFRSPGSASWGAYGKWAIKQTANVYSSTGYVDGTATSLAEFSATNAAGWTQCWNDLAVELSVGQAVEQILLLGALTGSASLRVLDSTGALVYSPVPSTEFDKTLLLVPGTYRLLAEAPALASISANGDARDQSSWSFRFGPPGVPEPGPAVALAAGCAVYLIRRRRTR